MRVQSEEQYSEIVTIGKEWNFQAIYADRAVTRLDVLGKASKDGTLDRTEQK